MHRLSSAIFLSSHVVHGFGRGSKQLGIPTANLEEDITQDLKLDDGIYYGFAQLLHSPEAKVNGAANVDQQPPPPRALEGDRIERDTCRGCPIYPMVASLGWNPQFANKHRTLEVHLMAKFDRDFYGSLLRIAICGYIRPEQKFESLDKLIETIHADIEFARQALHDPERSWSHIIGDRYFEL